MQLSVTAHAARSRRRFDARTTVQSWFDYYNCPTVRCGHPFTRECHRRWYGSCSGADNIWLPAVNKLNVPASHPSAVQAAGWRSISAGVERRRGRIDGDRTTVTAHAGTSAAGACVHARNKCSLFVASCRAVVGGRWTLDDAPGMQRVAVD